MSLLYAVCGLLAAALLVYLFAALLLAEKL